MSLKILENFDTELQTPRLFLKTWKTEYAQKMYDNWATDSEVSKYLFWDPHKNVEETKQIILNWMQEKNYNWCIIEKSSNEPIGSINVVGRKDINFYCEVGYCLSRKHWNKGYMTEALKAVITFLFSEGFFKIGLKHAIQNEASGRVMQKAGMLFESISYKSVYAKGKFLDCNVYYILNPNIKEK